MMINVNTTGMDAFRETMNATYAPVALSQADTGLSNNNDFMKSLENSSFSDAGSDPVDVNFSSKQNAVEQPDKYDNRTVEERDDKRHDERNDERVNRENDTAKQQQAEKGEQTQKERETAEGEKSTGKEEAGKSENSTEQAAASENTDENKNGKKKAGNNEKDSVAQEALKNQRLKNTELGDAKEGGQDNFVDAKTRDMANTAEKVVLKNVGTENTEKGKEGQEANSDKKSENLESKFIEELEMGNKDDTPMVQKESRVQKNRSNSNPDQNFYNLLNQDKSAGRQEMEVKVEKTSKHQNLLEQFQGLKENITENVENGIKVLLNSGESKVSVQLTPPELGKVQMELVVKDGKVNAKINTENIAVKEVILNNLDQLKINLQDAGATIDKFDVEVGGFKNQFDQHFGDSGQGNGKGDRGGNGNTSPQDPNEPIPGMIKNHQALSFYLGRSINVVI